MFQSSYTPSHFDSHENKGDKHKTISTFFSLLQKKQQITEKKTKQNAYKSTKKIMEKQTKMFKKTNKNYKKTKV